jgi:hypothetical protein
MVTAEPETVTAAPEVIATAGDSITFGDAESQRVRGVVITGSELNYLGVGELNGQRRVCT